MHSTQFAIREVGLYEPVLELAAEHGARLDATRPLVLIAGLVGPHRAGPCARPQIALALGYHAGMLSLARDEGRGERRTDRALRARSPR